MNNLLYIKDSNKSFELKEYFNSSTKAAFHLTGVFAIFSRKSIIRGVFSHKGKGTSLANMLQTLILMPFLGISNVNYFF